MSLVQSSIQKQRERLNVDSQISFNGFNQYATAGVNQNIISAIDYFKDFTISFFIRVINPASTATGNPDNAWPITLYQRHDAGSVFRYNGIGITTTKSGAPYGKYRLIAIMGRDRPYEGYGGAESQMFFNIGSLYHLVITYHHSSLFQFYVNGEEVSMKTTSKLGSGVIQGSIWDFGAVPLLFGAGLDLHNLYQYYSQSSISHFAVFNRIMTIPEIKGICKKGGILPKNTYEACVANYPCTQTHGNIIYDTIKSINSTATAYHANLINFSEDEVGLSYPSANSVWKDFYSKNRNYKPFHFYALDWKGNSSSSSDLTTHPDYFYVGHSPAHEWGSQDVEIEMRFALSRLDFSTNVFYKPDSNVVVCGLLSTCLMMHFRFGTSPNYIAGRIETLLPPSELMKPGKYHTLKFKKITHDANLWKIEVDGKEVPVKVIYNDLPAGFNCTTTGTIRLFAHGTTGAGELKFKELKLSIGGALVSHWEVSQRAGRVIKDLYGHADINMHHRVNPEYTDSGNRAWREDRSNKPPMIYGLRFRKANAQYLSVSNFAPTMEQGYTSIVGFALESNRNFSSAWTDHFFSKRQSNPDRYIGHAGHFSSPDNLIYYRTVISGIAKAITLKLNGLNVLISTWQRVGITQDYTWKLYLNGALIHTFTRTYTDNAHPDFSLISGDLYIATDPNFIGTRHLDGYLFYTAIAKGIITPKQVHDIQNNTFFRQPENVANLDWQLIVNYNRIINTGLAYQLEDLSGKGHTINMVNFSAQHVNPADPSFALSNINSLR